MTLDSSSATFIADLEKYFAPPPPATLTVLQDTTSQSATFDPNTLKTEDRNFFLDAINRANQFAFNNFSFALHSWDKNGRNGPMPVAPHYETLDELKFNNWCSWLGAHPGEDAPLMSTLLDDVTPTYPTITNSQGSATVDVQQVLTPIGANLGGGYWAATALVSKLGLVDGQPWLMPGVQGAPGITLYLHDFGNPFTATQHRFLWMTTP